MKLFVSWAAIDFGQGPISVSGQHWELLGAACFILIMTAVILY